MNKTILFAAFAACIPMANWLIQNVGTKCMSDGPCLIPVGFGLMAPSGVLVIGLALVLRDQLQEVAGIGGSVAAVLLGAILSMAFSPAAMAIASASAFLVSEMADLAVYTPLRRKGRAVAVLASGVVGAAIDSCIFVYLAFGSFDFSAGTTLAKIYASALVASFLFMRTRSNHKAT